MVWHHVAQSARCIIELAPALDVHRFRHGNLDMVDEMPVPDRLEQAVGEPKDHDVLDRLLAEIMVMRKIWSSERTLSSVRLSALADSRSVPNGFSTMTRRQPV